MRAETNNIGVLRLLFASMVVVGHSFEMVDGEKIDPLTRTFHTLTLGQIAVDGFFLISGYLITKSAIQSTTTHMYFMRRVLRIYPGFIVAYLITVFIFGIAVHAHVWSNLPRTFLRMILLMDPMYYTGQFSGSNHPASLNGSMWSIIYEFRCYIVIGLLASLSMLRHRYVVLAATIVSVIISIALKYTNVSPSSGPLSSHGAMWVLVGFPGIAIQLLSIFLVGSCFYLFWNEIDKYLNGFVAAGLGILSIILLYRDPYFAEAALTTFGAAALFWVSFKAKLGPIQWINNRWDISYGVYLYAWPITAYLLWSNIASSAYALAAMALPLSCVAGAASWWGVEKWMKVQSAKNGWSRLTRNPVAPVLPPVVGVEAGSSRTETRNIAP